MTDVTTLVAEARVDVGKGASRRLRRQGKVPAIIYGGKKDPASLLLEHHAVLRATANESFYSSIIELKTEDGLEQKVIVRDLQRHPFKLQILHIDFLRVSAEEVLRISVPIHFIGEEDSPAGRASGVVIQHLMTEVEISALPRNLPEFLAVDISHMDSGDVVMLSDIQLPEGVELPALSSGEEIDATICNAVHVKESQGTGAAAAAEAEAEAAELMGLEPETDIDEVEGEGEEQVADEDSEKE
jgi:large subunit ribosomal protein L25